MGQTIQTLESRKRDYIVEISIPYRNRLIIRAMRKYGFDDFEFKPLFEGLVTRQQLTEMEYQYMVKYRTLDTRYGYNLKAPKVHGGHSQETKDKIGNAQLGDKNHMWGLYGGDHHSSKLTIELSTGLVFNSITEASDYFGVSLYHAAAITRGDRGSTGGFVFRLVLDDGSIYFDSDSFAITKNRDVINSILPEYKQYINVYSYSRQSRAKLIG